MEDFRLRGDKELENLQKIVHPNLVSVTAAFRNKEDYTIIMEYCPGNSLAKRIDKKRMVKTPFDTALIMRIFS